VLFDLTVPAYTSAQLRTIARALEIAVGRVTGCDRDDVAETLTLTRTALAQLRTRERLTGLIVNLAEGEGLLLDDEGATVIRCTCEHPQVWKVERWGGEVAGGLESAAETLAIALNDHGLQRTDRVVGDG
jgi:hypothetical protein